MVAWMADPRDIQRLIGDLARLGTVTSVDLAGATARVQLGDIVTGDLPWLAPRAGATRIWNPPSVGEQVLVLCPEADLEGGLIWGALSTAHNPPAQDDGSLAADFADGASISYDPDAHHLMAYLPADATVLIVARGGLHLTGDLTVDGDIRSTGTITGDADVIGGGKSLKGHKHLGVQPGGGLSGLPQ